MTTRRLWLLVPSLLLAVLLLTGCDLPWPLARSGGSGQAPKQGPYVASLITRDMIRQEDLILAVEPQASTFYEGEVLLFVLNKWSGLSLGEHTEAAVVLTATGKELAREEATFTVTQDDLTVTLMEPFRFDSLSPGLYWVVIELDGAEQVRYRFQVLPGEG